jgi:ankyrin repeat protein
MIFSINILMGGGGLPLVLEKSKIYNDKNYSFDTKEAQKIYEIIRTFKNKELETMLEKGINANSYFRFKHDYTFLHHAFKSKNYEAVKLLIKYKANPNSLTLPYQTILSPISYAISDENIELINLLIDNRAYLNMKKNNYDTLLCKESKIIQPPLFQVKSKKILDFLISKGANPKVKSANGHTLLDLYFVNTNVKIKRWLIDTYKLPTKYFRCGMPFTSNYTNIIKVIHTENGYKEFDSNDKLIYEYKIPK